MTNTDLARLSHEYYEAVELERRSAGERQQKLQEYQDTLRAEIGRPLLASFTFRRAGHWSKDNNRLQYMIDLGYPARVERQMVSILHVGEAAIYVCSSPAITPSLQGVAEVLYGQLEIHPDEDALVD